MLLATGRRLSEGAGLQLGDVERQGREIILHFRRCKGGKQMSDRLPMAVSDALSEWLESYYGVGMRPFHNAAPLWVVLSGKYAGRALGIQSIADVCKKRLGTSKVHQLRHTWAHAMDEANAPASLIQSRLGHASLATTGRYLARLKQAENPYAERIADVFGIL